MPAYQIPLKDTGSKMSTLKRFKSVGITSMDVTQRNSRQSSMSSLRETVLSGGDTSNVSDDRLELLLTKKVHKIEKAFETHLANIKPIVFEDAMLWLKT